MLLVVVEDEEDCVLCRKIMGRSCEVMVFTVMILKSEIEMRLDVEGYDECCEGRWRVYVTMGRKGNRSVYGCG